MDGIPQPNSNHCFVCGLKNQSGLRLRFYIQEDNQIVACINVPEKYQGYPGIVHGGIVAAMLDEAAGRSHMVQIDEAGKLISRFLFTVRLDIRFRRNVPIGQPLTLIGRAGKSKGRSATAKAFLYDQDGNLLSEADTLLMEVPDEMQANINLDELGWKVYPEGVSEV